MLSLPSVTKQAANIGIELWIFTIMPALLPYTIISSLLLFFDGFSLPCKIGLKFFKKKLPESKLLIIICGYMCGCPIGAKLSSDIYKSGQISKNSAEFLMCACNNLSPSFLINYVFATIYAPFCHIDSLYLFFIIMLSSLLGSTVVHILSKNFLSTNITKHDQNEAMQNTSTKKPSSFIDQCILSAFEIQAKIGGYIIVFTIITHLFLYTLDISSIQAACLGSILELTSGLKLFLSCTDVPYNMLNFFIPALITSLTTFGGLCTIFQTKTVILGSDLSIKKYVISKFISAIFAFILTIILAVIT